MSMLFVTQVVVFLAALCSFICGAIMLVEVFSGTTCCNPEVQDCVGAALIIPNGNFADDVNGCFRSFFTLNPETLFFIWTPLIFGTMSLYVHFSQDVYWINIFRTWFRTSMWYLFMALFANFGYVGNFGIITGFISSIASLLCLITHFGGDVGSGPFLPISIQVGNRGLMGGPFTGGLLTVSALVSAVLTYIIGCMHIIRNIPDPCSPDETLDPPIQCVGSGLFWIPTEKKFISNDNLVLPGAWSGTLFSLRPSLLLENFTPFFMGLIGLLATLASNNYFPRLFSSYSKIMWWHFIQAVFANFGYLGSFGIMTGFISSFVALIALLLVLCSGGSYYYGAHSYGRGLNFAAVTSGSTYRGGNGAYRGGAGQNSGNHVWANRYTDEGVSSQDQAPPPNNRSSNYVKEVEVDSSRNKGWWAWKGVNNKTNKNSYNGNSASGGSNSTFARTNPNNGVSMLNMGSAGIMDNTPSSSVSESNRGNFGSSYSSNSGNRASNTSYRSGTGTNSGPSYTQNRRDESQFTTGGYGAQTQNFSSKKGERFESDAKVLAGKDKREMEELFGKNRKTMDGNNSSAGNTKSYDSRAGATNYEDRGPMSKNGILRGGKGW